MQRIIISFIMLFLMLCSNPVKKEDPPVLPDIMIDVDGNQYGTVTIGNKIWTIDNLKTTRLNNGDTIPIVISADWDTSLKTPAKCWYDDDPGTYDSIYGCLYNWYAVNTGLLAPPGWHVPSIYEYEELINIVNKDTNELKKLNLILGGHIGSYGSFSNIGIRSHYWSSTGQDTIYLPYAYGISNFNDRDTIVYFLGPKNYGCSVRCIKDTIE